MKKKQVKITWYHFVCVLNALTHMVKHARFILAQAVVLHDKSFVVSLVTKQKTESLTFWCQMIHVRKSFTTSSCCMKLRSEDDTCRKQWTQGCRTQGTCGRALSSPGPIVVPNGQQRLFLTPIEESAGSDTSGSLLSALRARHCYLKFSVTVATVILNGAMWKNAGNQPG